MGNKWLNLEMDNGEELDIPASSIITYEQIKKGAAPDKPDLDSLVRYDFGTGVFQAPLNTTFAELERQMNKLVPGKHGRLTKTDGCPIYIQSERVAALSGIKEDQCIDQTKFEAMTEKKKADLSKEKMIYVVAKGDLKPKCLVSIRMTDEAVMNLVVVETNKQVKVLLGEDAPTTSKSKGTRH